MFLTEPVLTKRIPTWPWGDPAERVCITGERYMKTGGYEALRQAIMMDPSDVIQAVKDAQLRGRGGAGFPCGVKWSFLPEPDGKRRYMAVNCDEAEPGTFKDRLLIDFDPHMTLEGIAIACWACQLDTVYFFLRGEYRHQAATIRKAIEEAYELGVFGPRGLLNGAVEFSVECHLHRGAGAYICGEETAMLEAIEGKRGWPRIKPPFPAIKGLFGRPTIVNNVETLAAVPDIIQRGAAWYTSLGVESTIGQPASYGTKLVGMSGHVNRTGVYEVGFGARIQDIVESEDYCRGMKGGRAYKASIPGGVSMGVLDGSEFGAELDFDIGRKYGIMGLGTACPIMFDEGTDMVMVARNIARFFNNESCGQCTPCRDGSQWVYQLLLKIEQGEARASDLDLLTEVAGSMGSMPGTTICGLADGINWATRTIVEKFRSEFEARIRPTAAPAAIGAAS